MDASELQGTGTVPLISVLSSAPGTGLSKCPSRQSRKSLRNGCYCEQNMLTRSQGGRQTDNHFTTNPNLKAKLRSVATMLGKPEPLARNPIGTR